MSDEANPFGSPHTETSEPAPASPPGTRLHWGVELLIALILPLVLAVVLIPAVQQSWQAARRVPLDSSVFRLKQITLALHSYHDTYGEFPPAYVADATGKPLYSWRVLLLPFVNEQALYDQFDLSRPWNEGGNRRLISAMPEIYSNGKFPQQNADGKTNFLAIVDREKGRTVIRPGKSRTFDEIPDGSSGTGLLVDHPKMFAAWSEPQDTSPERLLGELDWSDNGTDGLCVATADGSVVQLKSEDRPQLAGYLYCDDGKSER